MLEVDSELQLELDVDLELENSLRLKSVARAISTLFANFSHQPLDSLSKCQYLLNADDGRYCLTKLWEL